MDDILQNTLQGTLTAPQTPKAMIVPNTTGSNVKDIKRLKAVQQTPSALLSLQKAMQLSSRVAYNQRQKAEMEISGQQFDPTKVSGGTFAGIIGNLEARRGTDVSKIYASTMQTYQTVQQEITRRLERLQEIEESRRRWEAEQKQRKEEYEYMKKKDKEEAKRMKEQMEEDKRRWELGYAKSSRGAAGATPGFYEDMVGDLLNVTIKDGKPDPYEYNSWMENAGSQVRTEEDRQDFKDIVESSLKKFEIFSTEERKP